MVVNHSFDLPGRYEVSLQTSNQCSGYKTIYVLEAPKVEDETLKAKFTGPLTVEVGVPAVFEDATPNATQWEWRFGETNRIDASKQKVTYNFQTPGTKTVILIVNGKLRGELMVLVTPKPLNKSEIIDPEIIKKLESVRKEKAPNLNFNEERKDSDSMSIPFEDIEVETKFPDVSIKELETIVEGIVEGEKAIEEISAYACEAYDLQINFNGTLMNLKNLQVKLWEIKKKNRIRTLKITLEKDPLKNCIKIMNISLKKKWL
jgi:PKD repeat protein